MHLLDANVFIEAKNSYYGFETFPCFWKWLESENDQSHVASVQQIRDEILRGRVDDRLRLWATSLNNTTWFLRTDDHETQRIVAEISAWVSDRAQGYTTPAQRQFLGGGDPWLIAKAKVIGATVVTQEAYEPDNKKRVKIPNVCRVFGVQYFNTFKLLRQRQVVFGESTISNAQRPQTQPDIR